MDEINIKYPTRKFDFSKISLTYPKSVASGSYFTKIFYENSPLYLQIPKCTTKNGLVKTAKKMTSELLIDNMNEDTVGWFENLDNCCKELLQKNSEEWFGSSISSEDIDNAFGSSIRLYKSGKFSLVKTNIRINANTETPILSVYDEKQVTQPVDSITQETNIVAILEITGIRFTSRHFNTEIEMKQIMTVDDSYEEDICFNRCLIKPRGKIESLGVGDGRSGLSIQQNKPEEEKIFFEDNKDVGNKKEKEWESLSTKVFSNMDENENENENKERVSDTLEMYIPDLPKENELEQVLDTELELESEEENEPEPEVSQKNDELCEVDCLQSLSMEEITLNKPEEIYYELYRKTKQKAKEALLEAKRIKEQYQLDVSDWETDDDEDAYD